MTCSGNCVCEPSSRISTGVITDGPGLYANNLNCMWLISANATIRLKFTEFETQGGQDFISVHRCTTPTCDVAIAILNRAAGTVLPTSIVFGNQFFTTPTHPHLRFTFTSSSAVQAKGFVANWNIEPDPDPECHTQALICGTGTYRNGNVCSPCPTDSTSPRPGRGTMTCSGNCVCEPSSRISTGVITDGPGLYANNLNCMWLISANTTIRLKFTEFDTQGGQDPISIHRCTTPTCDVAFAILNAGSGTVLPTSIVFGNQFFTTLTHPHLRFTFTSSIATQAQGFVANWHIEPGLDPDPECPVQAFICGIGTYRNGNVCSPCPADSTSPREGTTSTTIANCTCLPGTYTHTVMNAPTCIQCAAGKFQSRHGEASCDNCPSGKHSGVRTSRISDQASEGFCLPCPENTDGSPPGSLVASDCMCKAGSSRPVGGVCTMCVVGKISTGANGLT